MQLIYLALSVTWVLPETSSQTERAAPQSQESVCDSSFLLLSSLVLPGGRDEADNSSWLLKFLAPFTNHQLSSQPDDFDIHGSVDSIVSNEPIRQLILPWFSWH